MYDADEQIIHRNRDEYGDIVITDGVLLRNLYFGNRNKQSSMYRNHSSLLVLEYTKAMTLSLIFNRHPSRILIIGMGGGSLCKFFLRYCPKSRIDVVELRSLVIRLAYVYFKVPEFHSRLSVIEADAISYIRETEQAYDLILVDAFDADGPAQEAMELQFLTQCLSRLRSNGLMCVNTWNRPEDEYSKHVTALREVVTGSVFSYQLGSKNSNALSFCFDQPTNIKTADRYKPMIESFQNESGIGLTQTYNRLRKQNESIWARWLYAS